MPKRNEDGCPVSQNGRAACLSLEAGPASWWICLVLHCTEGELLGTEFTHMVGQVPCTAGCISQLVLQGAQFRITKPV